MAGAGFKTFNTGDVLTASDVNTYLMQQTVMVFDDAAARTTALTGVVAEGMLSYLKDTNAVEVYDGSSWVASDDPNAIQNSIVDAKGDLISATADNTPARLAVGADNTVLTADSSTSTGLKWAAPATASFVGAVAYANGTTQSFTGGVAAAINYGSESFDTNSFHSTVSNTSRMTIPAGYGGKYLIAATAEAASNYASRQYVFLTLRKNGTNFSGINRGASYGNLSDSFANPAITIIADLAVNDYVEVFYQNAATYTETNGIYGVFSIQYLGA